MPSTVTRRASSNAVNKTVLGPLLIAEGSHAAEANIHQSLQFFDAVGLSDVSNSLLTRNDTKFLLSLATLQHLLPALSEDYSVLDIDNERIFDYHNLYLDSAAMRLFNDHHRGVYPRHKARYRYYQQTDDVFLELKTKDASKQTVKLREHLQAESEQAEALKFLRDSAKLPRLSAKLRGRYKRISLVSKYSEERLTLDFGLHFGLPQAHRSVHLANVVIAELKQPRPKHNSFTAQIRKSTALKTSFSKYCVGCCYLYPELKIHHFKPLLRQLDKLSL